MAIEIIKPIWIKEIDAYVATIGGVKYIIDIDSKPVMGKAQKSEKTVKPTSKKGGRALSPSTELIKSGASYEEVVNKFPGFKKSNYDQTRSRLGLAKAKKGTKDTDSASTSAISTSTTLKVAKKKGEKIKKVSKGKKGSSKAVKTASKPVSNSIDPVPAQ